MPTGRQAGDGRRGLLGPGAGRRGLLALGDGGSWRRPTGDGGSWPWRVAARMRGERRARTRGAVVRKMSQNTKPQKRSSNLHNSRAASAEKPTPTYRYREIPIQPPNVIARLMGIDAIPAPPPPPKPAAAAAIIQAQSTTRSLLKPPPPAAAAAAAAETTKVPSRLAPRPSGKPSAASCRTAPGIMVETQPVLVPGTASRR
ncbi:hypothetical protein HU200_053666 [Digitaria exilis]|uniref:DUF3741 domain-containing protein n=1 Tax=Digitaria exilis TaxID=1010633 RepID=A0A835AME5_9POAL|nr:hypothetical protein HU200_053666 [Digitaria exilis]